jgi:uncharacterized membrane protein (UPF0127 family)
MSSTHFLAPLLAKDAGPMRLVADGREDPVATVIETAFDSASRKKGLLGRTGLPPDTALIIAPCSAIHTFWMRFAIDVVFTARNGRILKVRRALAPSHVTMALRAFATIELSAGEADRHGLRVGDRLTLRPAPAPPRRV